MASMLLASFPGASSIATGGSRWRTEKCAKTYYASSYVTTTLWHKTREIQKEYCAMTSPQYTLKHHYKGIEGGPACQECERKYVANATSGQSFEYEPQAQDPKSIWDSVKHALDCFYRFSRPYSIISTVKLKAMCITSLSLLAVEKLSDLSPTFFIAMLQASVAAFCVNIFNCGVNQLYDIEIDKINKPYLPLASGEYSFRTGVIITASSLILSFWLAWIIGSWPLFWALFSNAALAFAYSADLPLLRWKKSPVLTVANIFISQGVAFPIGFFLHIQTNVFKRPATFPRQLILYTAVLSFFFLVIPISKDLPDIEGDTKFGIQSLPVRLGLKRVFWICTSLIGMAYGVAILAGATSPFLWSKIVTGLGHSILALVLLNHAKSVDLKNQAALQSFYMLIWKLLAAEYFLLPFFR